MINIRNIWYEPERTRRPVISKPLGGLSVLSVATFPRRRAIACYAGWPTLTPGGASALAGACRWYLAAGMGPVVARDVIIPIPEPLVPRASFSTRVLTVEIVGR